MTVLAIYQTTYIAFQVLALTGVVLCATSIAMYCLRTRDLAQPLIRVWMPRVLFTRAEYWINRIGFWVALASIFILRVVL